MKGNVNCCERKGEDNPLTIKVDTNRPSIIDKFGEEYYPLI
jgi:hypothetical protein